MKLKYLILLNVCLYLLISWYIKTEIITDKELLEYYGSEYSLDQLSNVLNLQRKWFFVGLAFIPLIYVFKLLCISSIIFIGILFLNIKSIPFVTVLRIVIFSYMIFLIPTLIQLVWFTFNYNYTLEDVQYFLPGSMLNIFDPKLLAPWLIYPIQSLNIWELAFWVALAVGLKKYLDGDFYRSMSLVAGTYGSGLVIWVVFVAFLTLNFT